jgi:peptidyl-dipeptidase Dcp
MKIKFVFLSLAIFAIFACSKKVEMTGNPLLSEYKTPFNTVPFDKIRHEHYTPAFDTAFNRARVEIDSITNNPAAPDFENTIEALEFSGKLLSEVSEILSNLNEAETDSGIQALSREMSPRLAEFSNDITLNEALFKKVKTVYENTDTAKITTEQRMLLDKTYKMFIRNGANLNETDKEEYRAVTKELSELTVKFGENVLAETNNYVLNITDSANLAGLPQDVIIAAAEEAKKRGKEGWIFTLQYPSFMPFQKYADNRELRKEITIAYNTRGLHNNANDNQEIIKRITGLRLRMANLLGYPTYAAFVLSERMAENTVKVESFLNELLNASMPAAKEELAEVTEYAKKLGANFDIQPWDWSYYSEKLKKEKFDIDDEATRPYFKLENVYNGVFQLANKLYGLTFKENKEIPVYNPDVVAYEVYDETGKFLAILYMDFFPREGKSQGAWKTEFKPQFKKNGVDNRPQISLVFNFTKPSTEKPSLLTYSDVQTVLHEFGHALHGMLSDVTYSSLSGTNVYRDFVELPSQIMENWAEQKQWLDLVAIHYSTGQKMPAELLQKIIESKNFNEGYASIRQLSFGLDDMAWHTITEPYKGNIVDFEKKATLPARLLPPVTGTAMSAGFNHIFSGGYAAGYYGYKWAEVLDADAFSLFKQNGIFDKATAKSFRDNILSKGGTEPPMILYKRFRGHEPSIEPLLIRSGLKKI